MTVRSVFNGASKKIHPAIGTIDDTAYVSVTLPCIIQGEKGTTEKELPFLITPNRQKILCNQEVLSRLRLRLEYRAVSFENRWSLKGIKAFLDGAAKANPAYVFLMVKEAWKTYIEFDDERIYDFVECWNIFSIFLTLIHIFILAV